MKFSKKFKIVAFIATVLVGAVLGFGYTKLRSSELKAIIVQQLESRLLDVTVTIDDLDYDLMPSFRANIKSLKIKDKENKNILNVESAKLDFPIWVMLFDKGTIKVSLNKINVSVDDFIRAVKSSEGSKSDKDNDAEDKTESTKELPSFLRKSSLDFSLSNSTVNYKDSNDNGVSVRIKSIQAKNASLEKKFNYSLSTDVSVKVNKVKVSPRLEVLGKLDLSKYFENHTIQNELSYKLSNIAFAGEEIKDISGNIKSTLLSDKLFLEIDSKLGKSSFGAKGEIETVTKKINISNYYFDLLLFDVYRENKNLKKIITLGEDFQVNGVGDFHYDLNHLSGKLSVKNRGSLSYHISEISTVDIPSTNTTVTLSGDSKNNKVQLSSTFLNSSLNIEAINSGDTISLEKIDGSIHYNDLVAFIPSGLDEFKKTQLKQEGHLNFSGKVLLKEKEADVSFDLKNSGKLVVRQVDGNEIELLESTINISKDSGRDVERIKVRNMLNLKLKEQPVVLATSEIDAEFGLNDYLKTGEIKGKVVASGNTKKKVLAKQINSSSFKMIAEVDSDKINVSELNGVVVLKEFLAFVPLKKIKEIERIEVGNAVAWFDGRFLLEQKKIMNPKFDFELSLPISVSTAKGKIRVNKLKAGISKLDENMNIDFSGEAALDLSPKAIDSIISSSVKFDGSFNGKKYTENKIISLGIKLDGKTKASSFKTEISYENDLINFSKIIGSLSLEEVKALAPEKFAEHLKMLNPNKAMIGFSGGMKLDKKSIYFENLLVKTSKDFSLIHPSGLKAFVGFDALVDNHGYVINGKTKVFDGEIQTRFDGGGIDKISDLNLNAFFPKTARVVVDNVRLENEFIKKFLYGKSSTDEKKNSFTDRRGNVDIEEKSFLSTVPPFKINLNVNNVMIGKESFSSKGDVLFKNEVFESNNLIFKLSAGYASINFIASLKDYVSNRKINAKIYNFNLSALNGVLPSILESLSGSFSGTMDGNMVLKNKLLDSYNMKFSLSVANGELKKLNLTDYVRETVEKIDFTKQFSKNLNLKVSDQFEKLVLVGEANNKAIKIDTFDFVGIKNSSSITGKGIVSQLGTKGQSRVELVYKDLNGKISTFLQKNVGKDSIPLRLTGTEFDLKPDYAFTIKEVGGNALKTQTDKILNKEAEKLGNKLGEKLGEKAGELLNKLFKKK